MQTLKIKDRNDCDTFYFFWDFDLQSKGWIFYDDFTMAIAKLQYT